MPLLSGTLYFDGDSIIFTVGLDRDERSTVGVNTASFCIPYTPTIITLPTGRSLAESVGWGQDYRNQHIILAGTLMLGYLGNNRGYLLLYFTASPDER